MRFRQIAAPTANAMAITTPITKAFIIGATLFPISSVGIDNGQQWLIAIKALNQIEQNADATAIMTGSK
jgi:hypothetical protein